VISRRSFLGTLAAAVAVGFAKVEARVLERPSTWMGVDFGVGESSTSLMYRGVPIVANEFVPRNVVYVIPSWPGGPPRYFANQVTRRELERHYEANRRLGAKDWGE